MTRAPEVKTDERLLAGGLTITVAELCAVYADHRPAAGVHGPATCSACGAVVTPRLECPSRAMARALLSRRRYERPDEVPEWIRQELKAGAPKLPRGRQAPGAECTEPDLELFAAEPFRVASARGTGGAA
jgi:hypothetical protein